MEKELELYLHIPFCVRKCAYCDFLSGPSDGQLRQRYVDALIKEIKGYKDRFHDACRITSIFIGGGTPSLLSEDQTGDIFHALHQTFCIEETAEITIEANPGTVTARKLAVWKAAGINRLSIGLQSVNDAELKMLGRIHTYQEFLETYRAARKQGFDNINIDLISAIPGQTAESWKHTLLTAAGLEPEHISAYSLIIEEGTPFYEYYGGHAEETVQSVSDPAGKQMPGLPDEDTERVIYELTARLLSEYGYQRYEISNYAKDGRACRHNLGYWERKEYLGIGLGASSLIGHQRYHHISDLETYIDKVLRNEDIKEDTEELSLSDEMEEFMFLGLRETAGVSVQKFREAFGKNMFDVYGKQLEKLKNEGLIEMKADMVRLTERGIDVSNAVFVEFLDPVTV